MKDKYIDSAGTGNLWTRTYVVDQTLRAGSGSADQNFQPPKGPDYRLVPQESSSVFGPGVATVNNGTQGYCQTCFSEYRSEFRLDKDGNCKLHGGKFGQALGVTKTKRRVAAGVGMAGALFLLFGSKKEKDDPEDYGYR